MMTARRRGAPVVTLGAIVGGWLAVRIAVPGGGILPQGLAEPASALLRPGVSVAAVPHRAALTSQLAEPGGPAEREALFRSNVRPLTWPVVLPRSSWVGPRGSTVSISSRSVPASPPPSRMAPASFPSIISFPANAGERWSADGWLFLRPGGQAGQAGLPTYGASQAGAVLRYRLAIGDPHRPVAYVRAVAALNGSRQKEVAAGFAARPLPALPVVAAAELRGTSDRFGSRMRPVIMGYTELPGFDLAGGWTGEAYLQGGYVAGEGATGFIDGQVRLDRRLAGTGKVDLRAGGGVWGGAQKGASRLDIGPTVQVVAPLSRDVFARVGLDWRFRVAGDAAPASGPALTLSAGF